ncbi:hypothetical protein O6H91_05G051100 [Diphasiastrum complanatum]|nr:hypothetical protein O6H91_05G051100 [Diphasiastrum complanatum]
MRGAGGGTQRTLEKLEKSVQAGNYYEAQQMYKTVYARYMASQNYSAVLDLLQSGACIQLKHGQVTCGVELGLLLIEALHGARMSYEKDSLDQIKAIYKEFPRVQVHQVVELSEIQKTSEEYVAAKTRVEGCSAFLKAAIK